MRVAMAIVVCIALLSLVLFFGQGGFGGGHGRFDVFIWILGFPWTWIVAQLPDSYWPALFTHSDATWLILVPLGLNLLFISLITAGIKAIRPKVQNS